MNKPIEKPILFSGPMVRAILDGTKTMTRRTHRIVAGRLWVKETHYRYGYWAKNGKTRITLEVTGARIERLQEISNEDIRKEGVAVLGCVTHRLNFEQLWDSLNGKTFPWASNPFVWAIEFRRIDAL